MVRTPQSAPAGGREIEVQVKAGKGMELRVEVDGKPVGAPTKIEPLEAGEVKKIKRKIDG